MRCSDTRSPAIYRRFASPLCKCGCVYLQCTRRQTIGITTCKRIYVFTLSSFRTLSSSFSSTGTTNFNDDRKYSSISLYNLSTQFPQTVSRTPTSYTSVHNPPVTFGSTLMAAADNRENYYAAADIVQVR